MEFGSLTTFGTDVMGLNAYHRTNGVAEWRQSKNLEGNYVGLEIETHNRAGRERTVAAVDERDGYQNKKVICEEDGSICNINGIEVITPPIKLSDAIAPKGFIDKLVESLVASGCTVEPEKNYGLHINVNVRDWDDQTKNLVNYWFYMLKPICQKLGGRTGEAHEHAYYWTPRYLTDAAGIHMHFPHGHYNPAWIRLGADKHANPAVMEIRYPKAILKFDFVRLNISLVYSLRSFSVTPEARWFTYYFAKLAVHNDASREQFKQLYLAWLQKQPNFKKLFTAIDMKPAFDNPLTLEETKKYAQEYPINPALQEQAVQWSDNLAKGKPAPKAAQARA